MDLIPKIKKYSILCLVLMVCFSGCTIFDQKNQEKIKKESPAIKIIYSAWPPDLISYLAQEKGFFSKNDLNVELIKSTGYEGLNEMREKIKNPKVWTYTILDFVEEFGKNQNTDAQIILIQDHSNGADAILAMPNSNIKSVQDLKGKKIGVKKGTISEFFLHIILDNAEINFNDIEITDMASEKIPKALKEGTIDAGIAYEPSVTEAINFGAKKIIDSKQEKNAIVDIFVAEKKDIDNYTEEYKKFITTILETIQYYEAHTEESIKIMARPFNMNEEELKKSLESIELTNIKNNKLIFSRSGGPESIHILIKKAEKYLTEQGIDLKRKEYDDLVNTNLIEKVDTLKN